MADFCGKAVKVTVYSSLSTDGLSMRKDVKRSLIFWPLSTAVLVTGVCALGLQSDPASRTIVAKANDWLRSRGMFVDPGELERNYPKVMITSVAHNVINNQVSKSKSGMVLDCTPDEGASKKAGGRDASQEAAAEPWLDLAAIQSWNDVSFEVSRPKVAGIPAPSLDSNSDLFGFEPFSLESAADDASPADNAAEVPVLEFSGNEDDRVVVDLNPPETSRNDLVIRVDPDLFFSDDQPLDSGVVEEHLQSGSPQMAERPTDIVELPPVIEAPDAVVADLSPETDIQRTFDQGVATIETIEHPPEIAVPNHSFSVLSSTRLPHSKTAVEPSRSEPSPSEPSPSEYSSGQESEDSESVRELAPARSATWPVAHRLIEQLNLLEEIAKAEDTIVAVEVVVWNQSVRDVLQRLPKNNRLGDESVAELIRRLDEAQAAGIRRAEQVESRSIRVAWLQAAFGIQRRLSVWKPIYEINSGDFPAPQHVGDDLPSVAVAIERLVSQLPRTGDVNGWKQFLLLDQLKVAFETGSDGARRELAQTFLARLSWPNLAPSHQQFLSEPVVNDVAVAVRPWASGAMDYSALLHQIERAESNAIDLVSAEIARAMQMLEHSNHPKAKTLAENLDTYYRNANVRFSLSSELLNHLMPKLPSQQVPVRTTLLGSRVTGVSQVSGQLALRLKPSPSTWEMTLRTKGSVSTRSVGRSGPAAISTTAVNPYAAETAISIKPTDVYLGKPLVDVGGRARLRGINTDYDGWPLVGTLVRSFAESEYADKESLANRIGRNRIRNQLGVEIDRSINEKVDSASEQFTETILGPLQNLRLEPSVIDMSTTESRLVARYRMAGDWQLAAMTPRPRALAGNLFSVQMHQSALNNTLEQLVPQDQLMPIEDVLRQCFDLLGREEMEVPSDLPEDTQIQFARHRPITVEIEEGRVWITMRIIRLQSGKRLRLRNFIVRASYRGEVDALNASLVRDGHLSISGPGMSMRQRFPVRAIFNKVLSPNRPLPLTSAALLAEKMPQGSGVTQFELRDGWIAVSVGKTVENQRVAVRPRGIR